MKKTFNPVTHLWTAIFEPEIKVEKPKKRREKMVMTPTNEQELKAAEDAISEQSGE